MLTTKQRIFLSQSQDFQDLLNTDPYLNELNRSKYDHAADFFALMELLRGPFRIGNMPIQPLTPAVWAFLWGIGNRYTTGSLEVTESDTDVFLYLLANGVRNLGCDIDELPAIASGFCPSMGLDYQTAVSELNQTIHAAFRPLEMLPKTKGSSSDQVCYDADWVVRLCSVAARESNEKAADIMFNMPLSTCFHYYVNAMRQNDTEGLIRKRTSGEIAREIVQYVDRLGEKFIAEHCHQ